MIRDKIRDKRDKEEIIKEIIIRIRDKRYDRSEIRYNRKGMALSFQYGYVRC
jgi:hypothetical protein